MSTILIKGAEITNEGKRFHADVLIKDGLIQKIDNHIEDPLAEEILADGFLLLPGVIDDQVHFREPGLSHKANIHTESMAAVAGGTTSFMEMPNTNPPAYTQTELEKKYQIAANCSPANYSFFMGASNDNLEEVLRTNQKEVCGIKVFMGSSTGNLLVDNEKTLEGIFSQVPMLIATHCEDEATVRQRQASFEAQFGSDLTAAHHPQIRNHEACYLSSSKAIELAKRYDTRLHILHISTKEEIALFTQGYDSTKKRITAEACVHHLWFCDEDYAALGNQIKCNPAIKTKVDRDAVRQALKDGYIDIIATDHAPHTWEEKSQAYSKAPAGVPLVQHSLLMMLELVDQGVFTQEFVVEKMSHSPAKMFDIHKRGFIREGYAADLVLVNPKKGYKVSKENILYKCNWSPLEGHEFAHSIEATMVNGKWAYKNGKVSAEALGSRLTFDRD